METGYIVAILLIALVCPIGMWLMMRGHRRHGAPSERHGEVHQHRSAERPGAPHPSDED